MRKDVMKKWVQALRSGKFKQGTGTLKQFNSKGDAQHCCLGVLCELYNDSMRKSKKKTLPEKVYDNDMDFSHGYCRFGGKRDDLPKEVMKWSGIQDSIGMFPRKVTDNNDFFEDGEYSLADLNDTGRKFKTIANIIEKNYEAL
jgi:hypothetical protein